MLKEIIEIIKKNNPYLDLEIRSQSHSFLKIFCEKKYHIDNSFLLVSHASGYQFFVLQLESDNQIVDYKYYVLSNKIEILIKM